MNVLLGDYVSHELYGRGEIGAIFRSGEKLYVRVMYPNITKAQMYEHYILTPQGEVKTRSGSPLRRVLKMNEKKQKAWFETGDWVECEYLGEGVVVQSDVSRTEISPCIKAFRTVVKFHDHPGFWFYNKHGESLERLGRVKHMED